MKKIPQFTFDKALLNELKPVLHKSLIEIEEIGSQKKHSEGVEQSWKCFDQFGDSFSFATCEVSNNNALGLKAGTVYLIVGPPAATQPSKEATATFKRFEHALLTLGAQRVLFS